MGHRKKRFHKYGSNPHNEPLSPRAMKSELAETILEEKPDTELKGMLSQPERHELLPEPERVITTKPVDTPMYQETKEEKHEYKESPLDTESSMEGARSTEKKIKNLTAAVILLGGLLVGSLLVDVVSLFSRDGLSAVAVKKNNVLTAGGKTWVAYADPKVDVRVITDEGCAQCNPDAALVWLRRILPTMEAAPVEAASDEGKKLIEDFGVTTLPAFVFGKEIKSTDFFTLAEQIFQEKNGSYLLDTAPLGLTPGKYLKLPEISDTDIRIGNPDAKVKIVEYSDFQCPYCRAFHPSIKQAIEDFGDQIYFSYKHLPLSFHPQAENAALAAECANEQGKYQAFADRLFEDQSVWGNTTGTQAFKVIARQLGLKTADFNACLDDKKYADKVASDANEAASFGISGTPGTFVGDTFIGGAVGYEELKKAIEEQLAK